MGLKKFDIVRPADEIGVGKRQGGGTGEGFLWKEHEGQVEVWMSGEVGSGGGKLGRGHDR